MKKILLIGGNPRCGKTTLAKAIAEHAPAEIIHGDAMWVTMRKLEKTRWAPSMKDPEVYVDVMRRRDRRVAEACTAYAIRTLNDTDNLIIEGQIWPDFIEFNDIFDYHNAEILKLFVADPTGDIDKRVLNLSTRAGNASWIHHMTATEMFNYAHCDKLRADKLIGIFDKCHGPNDHLYNLNHKTIDSMINFFVPIGINFFQN